MENQEITYSFVRVYRDYGEEFRARKLQGGEVIEEWRGAVARRVITAAKKAGKVVRENHVFRTNAAGW